MPYPGPIRHQDRLLTLNVTREEGICFPDIAPGVTVWPLFIDSENGVWTLYARYAPGTRLPMHLHTGTVHFYTVKGAWHYDQYPDDVQTAGSYLFEPAGSMHSFCVPDDAAEDAEGFMVISGANVNLDGEGKVVAVENANSMEAMIAEWARRNGGRLPRFIRPGGQVDFVGG